MVEFFPATREMLDEFYGRPMPWTARAYVAVRDGQIVGVGGVAMRGGQHVAFTDHVEGLGKKDAARCARFMERFLREYRVPIFAVCTEGSRRLLERLGFVSEGDVMVRMP